MKTNKIFASILIISFISISISYADTQANFTNVASISEQKKLLIEESYKKEMEAVMKEVIVPEVINLPSLLTQPQFKPKFDDFFGLSNKDQFPIFKVSVSDDDEKRKDCVALTFDSAYVNKFTYKILDILDKYDAKATFFMTYDFMKNNKEQVMEIIKRGHEIGNHSTTHPDFNKISDAEVVREVMTCHNFIKNLVGVEMCLFRFPFGSYSPRTVSLLKNMGYYPIQWTYDSIDWKDISTTSIIERFNAEYYLKGGSIFLFHNGAIYTPESLPYIMTKMQKKGLKFVRVSDLIYKDNFKVNVGVQEPK